MNDGQAVVAQTTQPEPPRPRDAAAGWLPYASPSLSALSLMLAILAFRRAGIRDRREPIRDFILERIKVVREAASNAIKLVEANLTEGTRGSQRNAQAALKELETKVPELETALPCRKDDIFRAWSEWKRATTGGAFPVSKKANTLSHGDAQFSNIQAAHAAFLRFLSEIELGCLKASIPFWKRLKAKRG